MRSRAARVGRTLAGLGAADDLDTAVFIVDTCLAALADAATDHRPALRRPTRLRAPVAALLDGLVERSSH